ncbi:hypothetical protein [Lysinibacillus parviboronicapiens]|uniref:Uncharacterized protein n=1 Tax=Lysinibacillus parviboronicapiens TaxID=436516 RepID=A0ABV2PH64_9BACI|nr:hypothetical protein [Lysinibacillus parviboronicapiens]
MSYSRGKQSIGQHNQRQTRVEVTYQALTSNGVEVFTEVGGQEIPVFLDFIEVGRFNEDALFEKGARYTLVFSDKEMNNLINIIKH